MGSRSSGVVQFQVSVAFGQHRGTVPGQRLGHLGREGLGRDGDVGMPLGVEIGNHKQPLDFLSRQSSPDSSPVELDVPGLQVRYHIVDRPPVLDQPMHELPNSGQVVVARLDGKPAVPQVPEEDFDTKTVDVRNPLSRPARWQSGEDRFDITPTFLPRSGKK
ncbi:hypothetical protein ACFL5Q_07820 [Planctomycetota bacterium]